MSHLLIDDLQDSEELDRSAMLAVRGGESVLSSVTAQALAAEAKGGIAAVNNAVQTLVSTNTLLDLNIAPETNVVVGGIG